MSAFLKKILCVTTVLLMIFLVGCTTTIETPSDELVASEWYVKLENNNEIKLSFKEDNATMKFKFSDEEKLCLSGFCEISDNEFIIYDEKTRTPFVFEYIVQFDRVFVKFFTNTVSLYKI